VANIIFREGPRDGVTDWIDGRMPVTIGDGSEGGVYQQTNTVESGLVVFRWQPLTDAEANAIVRGDLRANQQ